MEKTHFDDDRQCRLCLNYVGQLLPIYGKEGREKDVSKKLQKHLHLKLEEDEHHICLKCLETVEEFEKFYNNVAQNQSLLRQHGETTVDILEEKLNEKLDNDDHDACEEEIIEEPVDLDDSFMFNEPVPESEPSCNRANPPSYDEVQHNKGVMFQEFVRSKKMEIPSKEEDAADDDCYMEKVGEGLENGEDEKYDVVIGTVASDQEENGEESELDVASNGEESGIIVKVNKLQYPRMIRDGKMIVRGEVLDQCMAKFYGLVCELCQQKRDTIETLFDHYRNVHGTEGYVTCCGRKIEKRLLIAMHMAKHLEPEAFECPHCKKMMTSPRILQFHIRNHLPEAERPLKCDVCPRRFSYVSGLLMHAATHQEADKSKRTCHICEVCGRAYRTRNRLVDHVAASHATDGSNQCARCEVCGKKFTSKSNLTYHMTTHDPKLHQVQCEHCGKWLKNKVCLRKHMIQHSDVRYRCNKCDYMTTNMQSMQNHLRVQHTDQKPHVCQVCGKAFKLRCNLRNHLPQHTGERKFTCEFCSRQFASSSNYYSHRKRMHFEEMTLRKKQQELKDSASRRSKK